MVTPIWTKLISSETLIFSSSAISINFPSDRLWWYGSWIKLKGIVTQKLDQATLISPSFKVLVQLQIIKDVNNISVEVHYNFYCYNFIWYFPLCCIYYGSINSSPLIPPPPPSQQISEHIFTPNEGYCLYSNSTKGRIEPHM